MELDLYRLAHNQEPKLLHYLLNSYYYEQDFDKGCFAL